MRFKKTFENGAWTEVTPFYTKVPGKQTAYRISSSWALLSTEVHGLEALKEFVERAEQANTLSEQAWQDKFELRALGFEVSK